MLMRYIVFILCLCCSLNSWAWSHSVHVNLGTALEERLSKKEKRYYRKLAKQLPGGNIDFTNMSAWVDSIRNDPLQEVFENNVPLALKKQAQRHTSNWHYQNSYYRDDKDSVACHIRASGRLEKSLLIISEALQEAKSLSRRQEAILIAFYIHLIEDAHQPLHTISRVHSDCSHDRGGNLSCVIRDGKHCRLSLHEAWDAGFGVPQRQQFWESMVIDRKKKLALRQEVGLILTEGEQLAERIYTLGDNRGFSKAYTQWARETVKDRLQKSVERLHYFLRQHYEQQR